MPIVTVGTDLAKNVFAVHGVDEFGKPVLVRPEAPRAKLLELIANLPPCLIRLKNSSRIIHLAGRCLLRTPALIDLEPIGLPNRRRRHYVAERRRKRTHRAPACAMACCNGLQVERPHRGNGLRNYSLVTTG